MSQMSSANTLGQGPKPTSLMGLEPLSSFMENKELVVTSDPHKIISMKLIYEKGVK
jgi:hypothetical protein